jgi:hypothetical protein
MNISLIELKKKIADCSPVGFIGAGYSIHEAYPSWSDLLRAVCEKNNKDALPLPEGQLSK